MKKMIMTRSRRVKDMITVVRMIWMMKRVKDQIQIANPNRKFNSLSKINRKLKMIK